MLKSGLLLRKMQTSPVKNSRILELRMRNFQGIVFI